MRRRSSTASSRMLRASSRISDVFMAPVPQLRGLIEVVEAGDVRCGDLPSLLARHTIQDALEDGARAREGRLGVRVVGPPQEQIDADQRSIANAPRVPLAAEEG